jgi:hypothetical protein
MFGGGARRRAEAATKRQEAMARRQEQRGNETSARARQTAERGGTGRGRDLMAGRIARPVAGGGDRAASPSTESTGLGSMFANLKKTLG